MMMRSSSPRPSRCWEPGIKTETVDSRDHGLAKPVLKAERAASVVSGCARVTQGRGAAT